MVEAGPMYGFEKFWQRKIYGRGPEKWVKRDLRTTLGNVCSKAYGNDVVFWMPNLTYDAGVGPPVFHGECLHVREEENGEFVPLIEVREVGGSGRCLYARKDFQIGEVITFLCVNEENEGKLGLGGSFARTSDNRDECNAYLTRYGALRSMENIKSGEAIVRWNGHVSELYERIGRLVVSPEGDKTGIINPRIVDGNIWVHYFDGSREAMDDDSKFGYVFRESTEK